MITAAANYLGAKVITLGVQWVGRQLVPQVPTADGDAYVGAGVGSAAPNARPYCQSLALDAPCAGRSGTVRGPGYDNYVLKRQLYERDPQQGYQRLLKYFNRNMTPFLRTEEC